jgi:hypothetical protein
VIAARRQVQRHATLLVDRRDEVGRDVDQCSRSEHSANTGSDVQQRAVLWRHEVDARVSSVERADQDRRELRRRGDDRLTNRRVLLIHARCLESALLLGTPNRFFSGRFLLGGQSSRFSFGGLTSENSGIRQHAATDVANRRFVRALPLDHD